MGRVRKRHRCQLCSYRREESRMFNDIGGWVCTWCRITEKGLAPPPVPAPDGREKKEE